MSQHFNTQETAIHQKTRQFIQACASENYFEALTRHLALHLDVDVALAGRLTPLHRATVQTLALFVKGTFLPETTYILPAPLTERKTLSNSPEVPGSAAWDIKINTLAAADCVAIPLYNVTGAPLGILALAHGKTIENPIFAKALLELATARTSREMQKLESLVFPE